MNGPAAPFWLTLLRWGLVLPLVLAAVYMGSYWWLWHTKSGVPVHHWCNLGGQAPKVVATAYDKFYLPARNAERSWRIASFGRKLKGSWTSEDGAVHLHFQGSGMAEMRGSGDSGIPELAAYDGVGLCREKLYLRSSTESGYLIVPPESIDADHCLVRVMGYGKPKELHLHRLAQD